MCKTYKLTPDFLTMMSVRRLNVTRISPMTKKQTVLTMPLLLQTQMSLKILELMKDTEENVQNV
jgi:hypothetical protein